MKLLERIAFALLVLGAAVTSKACGQSIDTVNHITFRPWVLRHWALQYREFTTEYLDCLYGTIKADTLIVVLTVPADVRPSRSTPDDVTPFPDDCPTAGDGLMYVGDAHSHPHDSASINGQRFHIDPNADLCYLSIPDQRSFDSDSAAVLTVVVCGFGEFMVWKRGDTLNKSALRCHYDVEFPEKCVDTSNVKKASE